MSESDSDVIEISDDSEDEFNAGAAGASTSHGVKRPLHADNSDTSDSSDSDCIEWVEDESESEPDLECDYWDEDCVIYSKPSSNKLIQGYHSSAVMTGATINNAKQQKLSTDFNEVFKDDTFFNLLKDNFHNGNAFEEKQCEIISDPWKVLVLNNVLSDTAILNSIRLEFNDLTWNERRMDLYEFFQSKDLKNVTTECIGVFYHFLQNELKEWVQNLTGFEITEVSATCSFYGDTDYLLVHDDQRENRAVAFVFYLAGEEGWCTDWGGALELIDRDESNLSRSCTRRIYPRNNQLVLFPVTEHSYHQVEEVTNRNFCRLSINGWFHVKEPLQFNSPIYIMPAVGLNSDHFEEASQDGFDLSKWIFKGYFEEGSIRSIQAYIEENSEISLEAFFLENKIEEVTAALKSEDIIWERMGPSNKRNYEYLPPTNEIPEILKTFINVFKSKEFFESLHKFTGLDITKMKWEFQRWTSGNYCLLEEINKTRLDVIFHLGDFNIIGGQTHYVTLEDEVQNALITISPEENSISFVYGDTSKYTSLVSHYNKSKTFYTFTASYFEEDEDEEEEDVA